MDRVRVQYDAFGEVLLNGDIILCLFHAFGYVQPKCDMLTGLLDANKHRVHHWMRRLVFTPTQL